MERKRKYIKASTQIGGLRTSRKITPLS